MKTIKKIILTHEGLDFYFAIGETASINPLHITDILGDSRSTVIHLDPGFVGLSNSKFSIDKSKKEVTLLIEQAVSRKAIASGKIIKQAFKTKTKIK